MSLIHFIYVARDKVKFFNFPVSLLHCCRMMFNWLLGGGMLLGGELLVVLLLAWFMLVWLFMVVSLTNVSKAFVCWFSCGNCTMLTVLSL